MDTFIIIHRWKINNYIYITIKKIIKWNGHIWIYKECMGNRGYIPYKIRECIYFLMGIIHFVYGI